MKPLPMPLRLAAGLVATAIEEVQELPRKLVELPVTAVSQVLQASMRMQQRVTELAIKGDQALGGLRPVPETPTWARFDEDEMDSPYGGNAGSYGGGAGPFGGGLDHPFGGGMDRPYGGTNGVAGAPSDSDWNVPPPRSAPRTVSPIRIARDPEPDDLGEDEFEDLDFAEARGPAGEPEASSAPESATRAPARPASTKPPTKPASKPPASKPTASKPASKPAASKPPAKATKPSAAGKPTKPEPTKPEPTKPSAAAKPTKPEPTKPESTKREPAKPEPAKSAGKSTKTADGAGSAANPEVQTGPGGFEDYPSWTLPQLRGRFRSLELKDVQALLAWETSHLDRPPYVTMLSNRIASITGR